MSVILRVGRVMKTSIYSNCLRYIASHEIPGREGCSPFNHRPLLIGIAGGSASGKTTICQLILEELNHKIDSDVNVQVICQDSFYRKLDGDNLQQWLKGKYNFDHPVAFDNEKCYKTLTQLLGGKATEISEYDYAINNCSEKKIVIKNPDVLLLEGLLIFYFENLRNLFEIKVFIDVDDDIRLARRILRDTFDRGRDLKFTLHQYLNFVKPSFEEFCLPTKKYADLIIPGGADNMVGIQLLVDHIMKRWRYNVTLGHKEISQT